MDSNLSRQLTPLASRFHNALQTIADNAGNPQYGMVIRAFTRHLSRNPMTDDEIREGLGWIKKMVDGVLIEPLIVLDTPAVVDSADASDYEYSQRNTA